MSYLDAAIPEINSVSELKYSDIDPWKSNLNHNVLLIGPAGTGATIVSNKILVNHVQKGGIAWALRWGQTPDIDKIFGYKEYWPDRETPISLNPFSFLKTKEDLNACESLLVEWLQSLLPAEAYRKYRKEEIDAEILAQAIVSSWTKNRENCGLSDILATLDEMPEDAKDLAIRLRFGLHHLDPAWFNGTCDIDASKQYVSVCPSKLSQSYDEILLARTILALYGVCLFTTLPREQKKLLIIDELEILDVSGSERLLGILLRKARVFNSSILVTTHGFKPELCDQRPIERVVFENCDNQLILSDIPRYLQSLISHFTGDDLRKYQFKHKFNALWIQNGVATQFFRT